MLNGTDNVFPVTSLPKRLFVQGNLGSVAMRDSALTLTHDCGASAQANFTVLWVTVVSKYTGTVDNDNAAQGNYYVAGIPASIDLGYRLYLSTMGPFNSRGCEFIGLVEPAGFRPSQFGGAMLLRRNIFSGNLFYGPNGYEKSETVEAASDTSQPAFRDDDPQSGGSAGKIYDVDSPGINALFQADDAGVIVRQRTNYNEWAEYGGIRCSTIPPWYSRQSYKRTGPFSHGPVTGGSPNSLQDDQQSWALNEWMPGVVFANLGSAFQYRSVVSNNVDTLYVEPPWSGGVSPGVGWAYQVISVKTWSLSNDVAGDNVCADGITNISWNLQ